MHLTCALRAMIYFPLGFSFNKLNNQKEIDKDVTISKVIYSESHFTAFDNLSIYCELHNHEIKNSYAQCKFKAYLLSLISTDR